MYHVMFAINLYLPQLINATTFERTLSMECFLVAEANVSKPFWMFGAHSLKINKQTKMSRKKTTEDTYMHDINLIKGLRANY